MINELKLYTQPRSIHKGGAVSKAIDRGILAHWYVYILILEDQKVYVGITTDVSRRFQQHQAGVGARYTKTYKPISIFKSAYLGYMYTSEAELYEDALSHEVGNSVGFANCHGGHYQGQGGGKKSLKYHKIPQRYKRFVSIKGLNSHRVKHSAPRKLTIDQKMRQLKRKRRKNNRYQFARQIDPPPPIHVPEARKLTDDEKLDILHNLELVALRAEQKRLKEKLEWQYEVDKDIMDKLKIHLED